jgi:hypothetical protein
MNARNGRKHATPWIVLLAVAALVLPGCRQKNSGAPPPAAAPSGEAPSLAAAEMIEKAKTPEEKRELEQARDEVDKEMRDKARALDEEIERLRQENEALKK